MEWGAVLPDPRGLENVQMFGISSGLQQFSICRWVESVRVLLTIDVPTGLAFTLDTSELLKLKLSFDLVAEAVETR